MADETPVPEQPTLRQALVAALGLPPETFMLELLLSDVLPVVIRCHYYPTPEAMQQAVVVLGEYHLVAKQTQPEVPAPPSGPPEEAV
jgi:hypothetical protein